MSNDMETQQKQILEGFSVPPVVGICIFRGVMFLTARVWAEPLCGVCVCAL